MKLDIGGGTLCQPGYENIDPAHGSRPEFKVLVQDGIPLPDASVQRARASHVLEHIPKDGGQLIKAMNEVHRVLVPGGRFDIILPLVGFTEAGEGKLVAGWQPHADPTHVTHWWFPESLLYFCEGPFKPHADYGIRVWAELRDDEWRVEGGWEGHATLRKPYQ